MQISEHTYSSTQQCENVYQVRNFSPSMSEVIGSLNPLNMCICGWCDWIKQ